MIKSYSGDQGEILRSILDLNGLDRFDADITYGNGCFYKDLPEPLFRSDIDPQVEGVMTASSDNLPFEDNSLGSVVFDPPFLTYIRAARQGNGDMVMANRFGGYWRYDELENHYKATLSECARVLSKKGILVIKCQDIIHNHRHHPTHINIINWMGKSFRLKDLFVLISNHRMPIKSKEGEAKRVQKHARIFHSYFMVLERL